METEFEGRGGKAEDLRPKFTHLLGKEVAEKFSDKRSEK